jgi:hypothetical protein
MVPSGYEDGRLGSLKPTDGTGDFTFSRCDGAAQCDLAATRVNADGNIEKGYENRLLQSNQFDTTWVLVNDATLASGQTGYDGSSDAWLAEKSASSNSHLRQNISISGVYTFSLYAKSNTLNGILIQTRGESTKSFQLNLSTGAIGDTTSDIDSKIEDVGDGWWRISLTGNDSGITQVRIFICEDENNFGTIAGSIYIQDAMLNQGMVAYPYIETTTASVAGGILEDMPRLDYSNGSCPSLLLEPSRTNLVAHSEYFDYLLNGDAVSLDYNNLLSPEGYVNAVKCTPRAVSALNRLEYQVTLSVPKTYTFSMFAKENGYDYFLLRFVGTSAGGVNASFNLATGEKDYTSSGIESTIEPYANGWYRLSVTMSVTSSLLRTFFRPQPSAQLDDSIGTYTGNGTSGCYIYGLQLEQDATYPTSYIPTYGVSQTRLRDICDVSNVASLIGQTEGTYVLDWVEKYGDSSYNLFGLSDGSTNNYIYLYLNRLGQLKIGLIYSINNQLAFNDTTIQDLVYDERYKAAVVYTPSSIKLFLNGQLIVDESNFNYTGLSLDRLKYNGQTGNNFGFEMPVNQTLLFPTALSDEACIELTTI